MNDELHAEFLNKEDRKEDDNANNKKRKLLCIEEDEAYKLLSSILETIVLIELIIIPLCVIVCDIKSEKEKVQIIFQNHPVE